MHSLTPSSSWRPAPSTRRLMARQHSILLLAAWALMVSARRGCRLVRELTARDGLPGAAALVRGERYTSVLRTGCTYSGAQCSAESLDPQCSSGADDCTESRCTTAASGIDVRFNSRTYLLANEGSHTCGTRRAFGDGKNYSCVDYQSGAYKLAGQTLSFTIDLSGSGCGCNIAVYAVAMPQNADPTVCRDHYCDANNICNVRCAEIDLLEANSIALVSTPHVAGDAAGEGFGIAHYVVPPSKRLTSADACPYGPRAECTVDTRLPFTASFTFSPRGTPFGYSVTLEQRGRTAAIASPVRYISKPRGSGSIADADSANALMRSHLDNGMTLVLSHWAGKAAAEMAWLDGVCTQAEIATWRCHNAWTEHADWPWTCDKANRSAGAPTCASSFHFDELKVGNASAQALDALSAGIAAAKQAATATAKGRGGAGRGGRGGKGKGRGGGRGGSVAGEWRVSAGGK